MNSLKRICAFGVASIALAMTGCGNDSADNTSDGNSQAHAYVTSCMRLCDSQADKGCDTGGMKISGLDCWTVCDTQQANTGDCATKWKLYGDCTDRIVADKPDDVCSVDKTCASDLAAAKKACSYTN